jgi:FkbM family methyltransferase
MTNKEKVHFVDCGANVGQSIEWAKDQYGDRLLRIDSFEPLPENFKILKEKYQNNKLINLNDKAVWKRDGNTYFYTQNWGARTGSSLAIKHIKAWVVFDGLSEKVELSNPPKEPWSKEFVDEVDHALYVERAKKTVEIYQFAIENGVRIAMPILYRPLENNQGQTGERILVDCIDLAAWIKSNLKKENYNVLKLDIESSEYELLPHLLQHNVDEYIDKWYVEFHRGTTNFDQGVIDVFSGAVDKWEDWLHQADKFDERLQEENDV